MTVSLIYWIIIIMGVLCAFVILMILTWNMSAIRNQEKIQRLQLERQIDILKATISGQELERKRISENLHDDIGPLLSALKIQLLNVQMDSDTIDGIRSTLNDAVNSIRGVAHDMSPSMLEELGLNQSVKFVSGRLNEYCNIDIDFNWDEKIEERVTYEQGLNIYRIVQEAITNILKHANAKRVTVMGEMIEANEVSILIKDDGKGFVGERESLGLGLKTMQGRAESMNASFEVKANNPGTAVILIIPLNQKS